MVAALRLIPAPPRSSAPPPVVVPGAMARYASTAAAAACSLGISWGQGQGDSHTARHTLQGCRGAPALTAKATSSSSWKFPPCDMAAQAAAASAAASSIAPLRSFSVSEPRLILEWSEVLAALARERVVVEEVRGEATRSPFLEGDGGGGEIR